MTTTPWLAPGAEAISEFARQSSGIYLHATCVETSAAMCLFAQRPDMTVAPAQMGNYLQQMVNDWRAADSGVSSQGASNYGDATNWLRKQGLQVDENVIDGNWWQTLQTGLEARCVFLVGVTNAQGLPGDEQNVFNHGLAALGIDTNGNIICGDPDNWRAQVNMAGNPIGQFVTYTEQDFINGHISSLTKVYPAMLMSDPNFTVISDSDWQCNYVTKLPCEPAGKEIKHHVHLGILAAYRSWPAQGLNNGVTAFGLPLSDEIYPAAHPGVAIQFFQRGILIWDPHQTFFDPSGTRGQQVYAANLDDPRLAPYLQESQAPVASDPKLPALLSAVQSSISALSAAAKAAQ